VKRSWPTSSNLIRTSAGEHVERHGRRSSYTYRLEVFIRAVREGSAMPIDVEDAVANMRLIDACYLAAGLPLRPRMQRTTVPGAQPSQLARR
jgi:predicted dehydrogenase